jgi:hypothetical protein
MRSILAVAAAVCLGTLAGACSSSTSATGTTASALTSAQSEIEGAADSLATARAQAKVCFDAFKACEQVVAADKAACRETLKACLPIEAPIPGKCGPHSEERHGRDDDDDADRQGPTPSAPSGSSSSPPPAPSGSGSASGSGSGARPEPPVGPQGHHDAGPHRRGGKGQCGKPPVRDGGVRSCRDHAKDDLDQGALVDQTSGSHDACVGSVFAEAVKPICDSASALCANADAPAVVCASVKSACAAP